jgi:galactokinase
LTYEDRIKTVIAAHAARTGAEPAVVYQAPGRVNLLGEHTDYSGGFCMPAALSFNTLIAASPLAGGKLRIHSLDFDETVEISFEDLTPPGKKHWSSYPFGVAWSLAQSGIRLAGAELTMQGNVPNGSGLSSSASVEVATATALLGIARAELAKAQVALACQKAENVYVGAPCGIMDQYISAAGVAAHALAIDTRALTAELAPIPSDLRLVVANSMVTHSVGGGEYGERRREVEEAAKACGVSELRDAQEPRGPSRRNVRAGVQTRTPCHHGQPARAGRSRRPARRRRGGVRQADAGRARQLP